MKVGLPNFSYNITRMILIIYWVIVKRFGWQSISRCSGTLTWHQDIALLTGDLHTTCPPWPPQTCPLPSPSCRAAAAWPPPCTSSPSHSRPVMAWKVSNPINEADGCQNLFLVCTLYRPVLVSSGRHHHITGTLSSNQTMCPSQWITWSKTMFPNTLWFSRYCIFKSIREFRRAPLWN